MNYAHYIYLHSLNQADSPALETETGKVISYAELDHLAARVAGGLKNAGVRRGDVVGVLLRDTPEHVFALLGIMRIGAITLPMDWRWRGPEVVDATMRFGPKIIVVEDGRHVSGAAENASIGSLLSAHPDSSAPVSLENEPAFYAITSGTTGAPKAAVITHEQMYARFVYYLADVKISKLDRSCCIFPLAYAAGRAWVLYYLCAGGTVLVLPPLFGPEELAATVNERGITSVGAPPPVSRGLLKLAKERSAPPLLGGLRIYVSITSGLTPEENEAFREWVTPALVETYANMAGGTVTALAGADYEKAPGSVGRAVHGAEIQIVDDEDNPVAIGKIGNIRHRGDGVASGFLLPGDAGNEKFQDGWIYPGDVGRIDEHGYLYLYGRSTEIIKFAGMTVYAAEVEKVIAEFPGVLEAAVIGLPSTEYGEEVAACITTESTIESNDLLAHCRRKIASYKIPRQLFMLEELPRNSSGKVVKAQLRELFS